MKLSNSLVSFAFAVLLSAAAFPAGTLVVGMAFEAWIFHPADVWMLFEELRNRLGVLNVPVHAEAQRLKALDGLPAVEGRLAGADVAQDVDPRLDREGREACGRET